MSSTNDISVALTESAEAKRVRRLQRRRERERARRASETVEQGEERLSRRRIRDRARREAQSVEQRQTLLQHRLITCAEMHADHIVSSGLPHNNALHFSTVYDTTTGNTYVLSEFLILYAPYGP